jgi:DNA polymerase III alpha subunit
VPLSTAEVRALVRSGACDGLAPLVPRAYPIAHEDALRELERDRAGKTLAAMPVRAPGGPRAALYRTLVRARNELAHLDMFVTEHPLRALRSEAVRMGCVPTSALAALDGSYARIVGLVAAARRVSTPAGEMKFVTFEDEHGLVDASIAPRVHAALLDRVQTSGPYLVGGRVEVEVRDVRLAVSSVVPFHERPRSRLRP